MAQSFSSVHLFSIFPKVLLLSLRWCVSISCCLYVCGFVPSPPPILFYRLEGKGNKMCLLYLIGKLLPCPSLKHFMSIYSFSQASSASRRLSSPSSLSHQWANVLNPFLLVLQFGYQSCFQRHRHLQTRHSQTTFDGQ